MVRNWQPVWLCCLLLLAPLPVGADVPHYYLERCASPYGDLPYTMNQLPPDEDPWEEYDEGMIKQWRIFDSVIEWSDHPTMPAGDWSYDYRNDIIGIITDSELENVTGYSWPGSAAGMCIISIYSDTNCIAFTDIVFNAAYEWTTDYFEALEDDYTLYYQDALLHELGHTFGLDDYDYSKVRNYPDSIGFNSVMNYYKPWTGVLGLDDAMTIQKMYPYFQQDVTDIGVYYYYCDSQTHCPQVWVHDSSVSTGDELAVDNIQVANLGNTDETDVEVEVQLVDVDHHQQVYTLGSFVVAKLPSRTNKLVDVSVKVPYSVPSGSYYLAFATSHDADYYADNTSISPLIIAVSGGGGDDDDSGGDQSCSSLMSAIYYSCGMSIVYLGNVVAYQNALLYCENGLFPTACLNNCRGNPAVDGCETLGDCFAGMCGIETRSDATDDDEDDDDDQNDSGCGL